jgi:hypothetical protein
MERLFDWDIGLKLFLAVFFGSTVGLEWRNL